MSSNKKKIYFDICCSFILCYLFSFGYNEIINSYAETRNEFINSNQIPIIPPDINIQDTTEKIDMMPYQGNVEDENQASIATSHQSSNSDFVLDVKTTGCGIDKIRSNLSYTDLTGTDENDLLIGATVDERTSGKRGDDIVQSNEGSDIIFGNGGKDRLQGGSAADSIFGEQNNDIIIGGNGDDYLCGGPENDRLYGGPGDDIMEGGKGADFFDCGDGIDLVLDFSPSESDLIKNDCEKE